MNALPIPKIPLPIATLPLAVACGLCLSTIAANEYFDWHSQILLEQGDQAYHDKQYTQALHSWRAGLNETMSPDQRADRAIQIGHLLAGLGRFRDAESLYAQVVSIRKRTLGENHPDTVAAINNLAVACKAQGQYAKAESLFRKVLSVKRDATYVWNLADLYYAQARYAECEPLYKEAVRLSRPATGQNYDDTGLSIIGGASQSLARLYILQKRWADAEPLYRESIRTRRQMWGTDSLYTASAMNSLADLFVFEKRYADAEPLYKEVLRICKHANSTGERAFSLLTSPPKPEYLERIPTTYATRDKLSSVQLLIRNSPR